MRIDFTPRLERNPLAFAQMGLGAIQGIAGWIQNRKATKALENMQSPTYTQNQGIMDYYGKALQRYNLDPYSTSMYKQQAQQNNRGLAAGLNALGGRRSALAGVSNLVQGYDDANLRAGAAAEGEQGQRLQQLGQASAMKAGEDQRAFEINQMQPFERKYNLKAMKAGGGADIMNAGISNAFGGLSSLNQMGMLDKMYGGNSGGGGMSQMGGSGMNASAYGNSVLQNLYRNQNRTVGTRNVLIGG